MTPKLSVIVPVYQVESYLSACIDSLLQQDYAPVEILLIDDGSTDKSGEICDAYAAQDQRIRVIHRSNGGLSAARNTGLAQIQGDYFTFVDSDDTVSYDCYKSNMEKLINTPSIDLLEYPAYIYYKSPQAYFLHFQPSQAKGSKEIYKTWMAKKGYTHTYAWNKIYKRSSFQALRYPEGKVFEDIYVMPQLLQTSQHYYYSNQGCYYYHLRKSSITQQATAKEITQRLESNLQLFHHLVQQKITRTSLLSFYMLLLNNQIDALALSSSKFQLPIYKISLSQLFSLNIPVKTKIKNLFLPFIGVKTQCAWIVKYKKWFKKK